MRIAFVSTILNYPWGGADVLWTRTAARALAEKHIVFVAVSPSVAAHQRLAALHAAGAIVHLRRGFTQQRGRRDAWRQALARTFRHPGSLTAALDAFRPDHVVLCQGGVFDFLIEDGIRGWLAETGTPFTLLAQSNDERDALSPDDQARAQRLFAQAHATVFVSTHNRDHAIRQASAPLERALVVPNPVELPPGPAPVWPADSDPRIAVVARLENNHKGLDILLDALARVEPGRWHIDVYGRGPDESILRARVRSEGLSTRLTFAGYARDVRQIWATHHLLLLPSRREGCGLAMLEALACGRPVLMTTVGGASDWVQPGVNGYICPPGDAAALASTLRAALVDQARWPALGAAGQRLLYERLPSAPENILLAALARPTA